MSDASRAAARMAKVGVVSTQLDAGVHPSRVRVVVYVCVDGQGTLEARGFESAGAALAEISRRLREAGTSDPRA